MSAPLFSAPGPADRVGDRPGGEAKQARRPPTQRTSSAETHDYMQQLHDGLVAAGHDNVPAVTNHPTYGRAMVLPPYEGRPARVIRCEEFEGQLCWRWKDDTSPPHTMDPIAPVTDVDQAVRMLGVIFKNRAGQSGRSPAP